MKIKELAKNKMLSKTMKFRMDKDVLMEELLHALKDDDDMFIQFAEANLNNCVRELEISEYILKLIENDRGSNE